jgi:hypothetical protein
VNTGPGALFQETHENRQWSFFVSFFWKKLLTKKKSLFFFLNVATLWTQAMVTFFSQHMPNYVTVLKDSDGSHDRYQLLVNMFFGQFLTECLGQFASDVCNWCLAVMFAIDVWQWCLQLMFGSDVCKWCFLSNVRVDRSFWSARSLLTLTRSLLRPGRHLPTRNSAFADKNRNCRPEIRHLPTKIGISGRHLPKFAEWWHSCVSYSLVSVKRDLVSVKRDLVSVKRDLST